MIRKIHEAKRDKKDFVTLWGSGTPTREFLFADDLAEATITLLLGDAPAEDLTNIGSGYAIPLHRLADEVCDIVGFKGRIHWDTSKPDGTPRRLLDSSKILALGWKPTVELPAGITRAYEDFLNRYGK
jgi:GDP-L-fucose synthase